MREEQTGEMIEFAHMTKSRRKGVNREENSDFGSLFNTSIRSKSSSSSSRLSTVSTYRGMLALAQLKME